MFKNDFKRKPKQIILFKLYLTEKKGHNGIIIESFAENNKIKTLNERLAFCYDYFIKNCPGVHVIELPDVQLQYTDIMHKYGCLPEHLNDEAYEYLSDELYNVLLDLEHQII